MQTIDILATNDLSQSVSVNGIEVPSAETISLQIKHGEYKPKKSELDQVDYFFISGESIDASQILNLAWLEGALRNAPSTTKWLARSLRWIDPYLTPEAVENFHSYR